MADKIEPQKVLEAIENCSVEDQQIVLQYAYETIKQLMTDAVPVAHGQWIHTGLTNVYGGHQHKCSVCGYELMVSPMCDNEKYCCNCGSKMEGDSDG